MNYYKSKQKCHWCKMSAVGYVGLPLGRTVYLCEDHLKSYIRVGYFVRRFNESLRTSERRFNAVINERHFRLRGAWWQKAA